MTVFVIFQNVPESTTIYKFENPDKILQELLKSCHLKYVNDDGELDNDQREFLIALAQGSYKDDETVNPYADKIIDGTEVIPFEGSGFIVDCGFIC